MLASFRIAEPRVGSVSNVVTFGVKSGEAVEEIAAIELIILSMIEPGSLVVASVGSFCGTFVKKSCLRAVSKNIKLVVTTAEGLDGSVEEDKYSPLIRFADGTVFTGSSKDIISSPSSLSSIPVFTCKDLLLAFSVWFTCVICLTTDSVWM